MKILLVTADPEITKTASAALSSVGASCDVARTGKEALARIAAHYDVYVFDWFMKGPDGIALTRAVRERGDRRPGIVLLSPLSVDVARDYAIDTGADQFLVKPFEEGDLLRAVKRCTPTEASSVAGLGLSEGALVA